MDMRSILTTLDLINQPKPADVIAEDEVEEELTLEELEALEEDDELEEAWISVDDFDDRPASEYKLISRSEEDTDHGTLRTSKYEQEDGEFTEKQIRMAFGILNDPRYKGGNLTDAIEAIEAIAPGLSEHPAVQRAMLATSESVEVEEGLVDADGNPVKSVPYKSKPKQKRLSVLDNAAQAPKTKLEPRIPRMEEVDETSDQQLDEAFSRKHYELFASMLQEISDLNARMDFADRLVTLFRQDNPRFNDELFLKAAGLAD